LSTARNFINLTRVQWLRGDPLLMGAAIAYNSLFALVPLAVAFVSMVELLDLSSNVADRFGDLITSTLPPEIAAFVIDLFESSSSVVGTNSTTRETTVLVISLLIALWSGSRAVYAVQKSLRLVQGVQDDRGYVRARGVGILVTIGAGISVMVGYTMVIFGTGLWDQVAAGLGIRTASLAQFSLSVLIAVWAYGLLFVVYRFGPPRPVDHAAVVALVVEAVLVSGSWFAFTLLPSDSRSAAAAFGVLGVILVLLYFVGVAVVAGPILVAAAWEALSDAYRQYASTDEAETVEPEGSTQRSEPPRQAPQ
jgi:membrane protein